ncbi:MAG: 1,4-alpha-glucan branching protein GlgB [Myxococcales bacterium]
MRNIAEFLPPRLVAADLNGDAELTRLLLACDSYDPHGLLGPHPAFVGEEPGVIVRAYDPTAVACALLDGPAARPMLSLGDGLFAAFLPEVPLSVEYRLRFERADGSIEEREDPYRFAPTLSAYDLYLVSEGTHQRLWQVLGANVVEVEGVLGTRFSVWAPNARRVSVIGDFNGWDGRLHPMRTMGASGVWELFVPRLASGALYKFELKSSSGELRIKTDPLAREVELSPGTAARVCESRYAWNDGAWLAGRETEPAARQPLACYEVHLGSWARVPEEGNRMLSYRELAVRLVEHAKRFGFTHLELMPIAEHAYYPSWGYLTTGYFAPAARYGSADDFRWFVDYCHQHEIGVVIDWVPAHFPKDDFALRRFDGSALYEHEDPRRGEHPDWGTLIFNLERREVRNFLTANALYWLQEFHIDGLRVDAVASMLYLDFSRKAGEWLPNAQGGRENLEAVSFLRELNDLVHGTVPGAFTVAEESTAWWGITRAPSAGGLGFDFKWNMGWMHDTLHFFALDPLYRKYALDSLTFAMVYEFSEQFINALSHDEVVYGKRALVEKMPGDAWQQLANVRLLLAYQYTRPGKQLLFMGMELSQRREWNVDASLDLHREREPEGMGMEAFLAELGKIYRASPALFRTDTDPTSFEWLSRDDENVVLSYARNDEADCVVTVLNFTPVPRGTYRLGVPRPGRYQVRLNSDDAPFGGSGFGSARTLSSEPIPMHGRAQSLVLELPPLGALILAYERQ